MSPLETAGELGGLPKLTDGLLNGIRRRRAGENELAAALMKVLRQLVADRLPPSLRHVKHGGEHAEPGVDVLGGKSFDRTRFAPAWLAP